ncbi:hypothetical protein [Seinonella peptonophila]|uniref:hypothetical protein n=1 Tax=Seinonella peptonophila TaxID=112248 RepID=UPI00111498DF|nr:hypothetical protein [Seinonella peptonophila]
MGITDTLYPIFIGAWAVSVSSKIGTFLLIFGAIWTGINAGAMLTVIPGYLGAAEVLEKKMREAEERQAKLRARAFMLQSQRKRARAKAFMLHAKRETTRAQALMIQAQQETTRARAFMNQALGTIASVGVLLGVTFAIVPEFLPESWLHRLGIVNSEAMSYFVLTGGSFFILTGTRWCLAVALRCVGQANDARNGAILIFGVNLILDPLLIVGAGWGLVGSTVGTITAQIVGIAYLWMRFRRNALNQVKASWRLTRDVQAQLWGESGGNMMLKETCYRSFPFLMIFLIDPLGVAVLSAYRLWTMIFPPLIGSVGLAAGTVMHARVATLMGSAKKNPTQIKALRMEYDTDRKLCTAYSSRLLVRYCFPASLLVVAVLSLIYLPPKVGMESGLYLLAFFGLGAAGWYTCSLNAVLELALQGAGKMQTLFLNSLARMVGQLLLSAGAVMLLPTPMAAISVIVIYNAFMVVAKRQLASMSKSVLK